MPRYNGYFCLCFLSSLTFPFLSFLPSSIFSFFFLPSFYPHTFLSPSHTSTLVLVVPLSFLCITIKYFSFFLIFHASLPSSCPYLSISLQNLFQKNPQCNFYFLCGLMVCSHLTRSTSNFCILLIVLSR